MATIQLEFEKLEILRHKERWNIYFVVVTEHPNDPDKMVMTTIPEQPIRMKPPLKNVLNFEPESSDGGADGLFIIERDMPADRTLKVRTYLRHSRKKLRSVGSFLEDMKNNLGGEAFNIVSDVMGTTTPWLEITKKALPMIGSALSKVRDRDFGMVNMDEEFGPEFDKQTELDRANTFSTGEAKIVWCWSVEE